MRPIRIVIMLVAAVAALPFIPLAAVILSGFFLWQARGRERDGYRYLWPASGRNVRLYSEVLFEGPNAAEAAYRAAQRLDIYLSGFPSPRKWRLQLLLVMLDCAPCFAGHRPFSWMSLERRRAFCREHLVSSTGVLGIFSRSKQLLRLGTYSSAESQARIGYRTFERKRKRATTERLAVAALAQA